MKIKIKNVKHSATAALSVQYHSNIAPVLDTPAFILSAFREMSSHIQSVAGAVPGLVPAAGHVVQGLHADNNSLVLAEVAAQLASVAGRQVNEFWQAVHGQA